MHDVPSVVLDIAAHTVSYLPELGQQVADLKRLERVTADMKAADAPQVDVEKLNRYKQAYGG